MVGRLIAGNGVYICDQCVDLCMNILEQTEELENKMCIRDSVKDVQVIRYGKVRRSKLYYLRDRVGKAAKVKEQIRK